MEGFFTALSKHAFLQTAVATALLASIGCRLTGIYVVVKRIAFIAGGITRSVLGGIGADSVHEVELETLIVYLKRIALTASLLAPLAFVMPWASADEKHEHDHEQEHRQHGAHVHGIAALNLALEGDEVYVELHSPAANIVGFEHAPSSEADHAALDKAVATLKDGDQLFRFNAQAGCRMEKAGATSALLDGEHDEHADKHSGDHEPEKRDGHDHEKQEHTHEGETHSDIEAAYHFECDQPGKLTQLTVELFEAFPGMEKLNVQYVVESKQGAAVLTPVDHVVKF